MRKRREEAQAEEAATAARYVRRTELLLDQLAINRAEPIEPLGSAGIATHRGGGGVRGGGAGGGVCGGAGEGVAALGAAPAPGSLQAISDAAASFSGRAQLARDLTEDEKKTKRSRRRGTVRTGTSGCPAPPMAARGKGTEGSGKRVAVVVLPSPAQASSPRTAE